MPKIKKFSKESFLVNKYNHLLAALLMLFIISPSLEVRDSQYNFPLFSLIVLVVLISAMRANFAKRKTLYPAIAFVFLEFIVHLVLYYLPTDFEKTIKFLSIFSGSVNCIFYSIAIYFLIKSLLKTHNVSSDTIKGSICAYILLGFLWATIYGLINRIDPKAFLYSIDEKIGFVYFSFTTLTTLGYGDIVPVNRYAALAANLEAVSGQLFIAILVARLMGLYLANEIKNLETKK